MLFFLYIIFIFESYGHAMYTGVSAKTLYNKTLNQCK